MDKPQDIYSFIKTEEANYQLPIQIVDSWQWSMKDHIKLSILYKNTQLSTGKDDMKPIKNITRPILNLQYRAEGFDIKDVVLYANDAKDYYKSFLIKKFHEKWAREEKLDTFIDKLVECYVDFGGALVKNVNLIRPEVVPLQSIVFCDQTDILSGPIGIKHFFSPDQIREMESQGWGDSKNGATATIDEVITLSQDYKIKDKTEGVQTKTPGKYIEVYEVHGNMPEKFLTEGANENKYVNQMQIVCFYQKQDGLSEGITLFRGKKKPKDDTFKLVLRDEIYGRALGFGGAEELFEPQVWINYDMIRMKDMLDAAAKTIMQTDDENFASRNKISDMDNLEIAVLAEGKTIGQVDTFPRNISLFDNSVREWEAHAQQMGAANDSIMGEKPTAGTPFKLQELVTAESHSLHEYRKGKLATFLDEIYKDWIIPHLAREIVKEHNFFTELDMDEMQYISEIIVKNETNRAIKNKILSGVIVDPLAKDGLKELIKQKFAQGGNKKFIEILKDEMKDVAIDVSVNIAGKQKDLAGRVDKLTNIFKTIIMAPQVLQNPAMAKLFNEILEGSGLSPIDFTGFTIQQTQVPVPTLGQPAEAPLQNTPIMQQSQ